MIRVVLIAFLLLLFSVDTFSQEKLDYENIKKMSLADFLDLLDAEEEAHIKDIILNVYFNSHEYIEKRLEKEHLTQKEIKKIKEKNNVLELYNSTIHKRLENYKDSVKIVKNKHRLAPHLKALQKRTIVSLAAGFNTLSPSFQVSVLKNFHKSKVSFWGIQLGFQKNHEGTAPIIFGLQHYKKWDSQDLFTIYSAWVSGFRENELAVQVSSKYHRILRGNTFGLSYGIGKMAKDQKKIFSFSLNIQKYTEIFPLREDLSGYNTKFAFGATAGVSFIIGGTTKTEL